MKYPARGRITVARREATGGLAALALLAGSVLSAGYAADWPQWRGPHRNGISAESGWQARWPATGPKRLWQVQVGEGYSSVAVTGGRLYTMGHAGGRDTVHCLDARTGKPVWRHAYPGSSGSYGGTRATPTVDRGRVFTLGRDAQAFCLDAATGRVVWSKNLQRETRAASPRWGFAGSPLVYGDRVIYNVGASGTAVDRNSGRILWHSGSGTAGYASPVAFGAGGQRGVALFAAEGLVAVQPGNGSRLWAFPWQTQYDVNAADPIFAGGNVFISSNYGKGGALLRVGGGRPAVVWQNRNMRNHFNSCVLVNGALYGNDENTLKCIDFRTGAERWRQRGMGKGGLIAAGGNLIALTERGELLVVRATPDRYTELARARVLNGTCWTHPVLANGLLYCRNHEGRLVCLDVRG